MVSIVLKVAYFMPPLVGLCLFILYLCRKNFGRAYLWLATAFLTGILAGFGWPSQANTFALGVSLLAFIASLALIFIGMLLDLFICAYVEKSKEKGSTQSEERD